MIREVRRDGRAGAITDPTVPVYGVVFRSVGRRL